MLSLSLLYLYISSRGMWARSVVGPSQGRLDPFGGSEFELSWQVVCFPVAIRKELGGPSDMVMSLALGAALGLDRDGGNKLSRCCCARKEEEAWRRAWWNVRGGRKFAGRGLCAGRESRGSTLVPRSCFLNGPRRRGGRGTGRQGGRLLVPVPCLREPGMMMEGSNGSAAGCNCCRRRGPSSPEMVLRTVRTSTAQYPAQAWLRLHCANLAKLGGTRTQLGIPVRSTYEIDTHWHNHYLDSRRRGRGYRGYRCYKGLHIEPGAGSARCFQHASSSRELVRIEARFKAHLHASIPMYMLRYVQHRIVPLGRSTTYQLNKLQKSSFRGAIHSISHLSHVNLITRPKGLTER